MSKMEPTFQYLIGRNDILIPYNQTKGTYFQVYQDSNDGQWHWDLFLVSSPQGAAARSSRGYQNRQTAEGTIQTTMKAMRDVVQK